MSNLNYDLFDTRYCIDCHNALVINDNWTEARKSQGKYLCKSCWDVRDKQRMFVNGKEVPKSNPLFKAGRWKTWLHVHTLEKLEREGSGYVYVIVNDAWPDWVKLGCAKDADDRLSNYQTYSPFRDYRIIAKISCDERYKKEKEMHKIFHEFSHTQSKSEWFKIDRLLAIKLLNYQIQENDNERSMPQ